MNEELARAEDCSGALACHGVSCGVWRGEWVSRLSWQLSLVKYYVRYWQWSGVQSIP